MKKIRFLLAIILIALFTSISANAATVTCSKMWVNNVAGMDYGNGSEVWLINKSGGSCGTLADGQAAKFILPSVNTNKMMATILTAVSLEKYLWVAYDDSTEVGALIVVAINNPLPE